MWEKAGLMCIRVEAGKGKAPLIRVGQLKGSCASRKTAEGAMMSVQPHHTQDKEQAGR